MVPVESQAQINTTAFLEEVDRRYQPERVLMEYNGMWPIQLLRDLKMPKHWGLYQAIDVIDASTFEMYRANMQSMVIDMVTEADMVFGFERAEIDGHDFEQIEAAFAEAKATKGVPFAIVMKTVKGKGVSYMENQAGWHGKAPNDEEYEIAMKELRLSWQKWRRCKMAM